MDAHVKVNIQINYLYSKSKKKMYFFVKGGINILWFLTKKQRGEIHLQKSFMYLSFLAKYKLMTILSVHVHISP